MTDNNTNNSRRLAMIGLAITATLLSAIASITASVNAQVFQPVPSQTPMPDQPKPVIKIPAAPDAMDACLKAGYSQQRCEFLLNSPDLGICGTLESAKVGCPAER